MMAGTPSTGCFAVLRDRAITLFTSLSAESGVCGVVVSASTQENVLTDPPCDTVSTEFMVHTEYVRLISSLAFTYQPCVIIWLFRSLRGQTWSCGQSYLSLEYKACRVMVALVVVVGPSEIEIRQFQPCPTC